MRSHGLSNTGVPGMTGTGEADECGPGLCWFALQRLPPLLEAFEKEIEGVRDAEDIEYIHRMRVASRRLRAALPLFEKCFTGKQYSRWMEEITGITRALGAARDIDVQIAFLEKCRTEGEARTENGTGDRTSPGPLDPALIYLMEELRDQRQKAQSRVVAALDNLEKSGVTREMQEVFDARAARLPDTPPPSIAYGIPAMAAFRIGSRLAAMRAYELWVTHADAVAEHHAMRIAAKKLRYTMEVYGPVYKNGLKKSHARVKKLQEVLGDLHDCDVWIDGVTRLLLKERGRMRSKKRPDTATIASLRLFLQDRERERSVIYGSFLQYWKELDDKKAWDEIPKTLVSGRKKEYVPEPDGTGPQLRSATGALAASFPEKLDHHRDVTRLSLMLFDALLPLHHLPEKDRSLLECAGMLHDIGWTGGKKQHHIRSGLRVFSNESLPLDIEERSMAGLVAAAHRGNVSIAANPLFTLLAPDRQDATLRLAAILRIADGLDYLHTGAVQEVHCIIGEREVVCDIVSTGDVTTEKERARARSDLFCQVFGRELVIR